MILLEVIFVVFGFVFLMFNVNFINGFVIVVIVFEGEFDFVCFSVIYKIYLGLFVGIIFIIEDKIWFVLLMYFLLFEIWVVFVLAVIW